MFLPHLLLKNQSSFWEDAQAKTLRWKDLLPLVAFIVLACAIYGAILAGWRSPLLSLFVAIKLPLLFLATTAIVSVFNWMFALGLGSELSFKQTLFLACSAMTITSWILLALAPVALFFLFSGVNSTGSDAELHYAHNCILMTHILIIATAGIAGNAALLKGMRQLVAKKCPANLLFISWLGAFAFVGAQMSWILRPFVGSPFFPVAFMRSNCLERNFYEFVFTEILPYLATGGS